MSQASDLAKLLNVDRPTLKRIYEKTRLDAHPESPNFLLLGRDLQPNQDLTEVAFQVAEDKGWLPALALALLVSQPDNVSIRAQTKLQSLINPKLGFDDVGDITNGLLRCLRQVCLVNVEGPRGNGTGTGFLVGPDVVMTSWHVIEPLLDPDGKPAAGSGASLSVEFDKFSGQGPTSVHHAVGDDWLIASSPCLPGELANINNAEVLPEDTSMKDHLDYAIVSLQDAPGHERSWVELGAAVIPRTDSFPSLHILQHPSAMDQQRGTGTFTGWRPDSDEQRLLYTNNTGSGSSGGLIVDHQFRFVGIHQGEVLDSDTRSNTGISGKAIADHVTSTIGIEKLEELDSDKAQLHRLLRNTGPIIGRRSCQETLTKCRKGEFLVMAVSARGRRAGKTFTHRIMEARLPETDHVIAMIDADHHLFIDDSIGDSSDAEQRALSALDPVAVAKRLLESVGAHSDGLPEPPSATTADSGAATWVQEVLFPAFKEKINAHPRADSLLWVVIDNIDADRFRGSRIDVFIESLLENVSLMPNLRIVLLGYQGKPPVVGGHHFASERLDDPGRQDVERYVGYRFNRANLSVHPDEIRRLAQLVYVSGGEQIEPLSQYVQEKVDEVFRELERA
jgi:hypothetical protein